MSIFFISAIGLIIVPICILFISKKNLIKPQMGKGKEFGLAVYVDWLRNNGYTERQIAENIHNQTLHRKCADDLKKH